MSVRLRFAPSPTGPLHLGNARTALFNWLFARKHAGCFLLRIEDTDLDRSAAEWEAAIVSNLTWLGLHWDEEIVRQSSRREAYRTLAERLLGAGAAYRCFCTPEELEARRQEQVARGQPPRYDGRCRPIPPREAAARERAGEPAAVRFRMPVDPLTVADIVKGGVNFRGEDLGDFIIVRVGGSPTYNFAAAVDDAWMRVTHVIRGDDHLANTPRQMALARALGFEPPQYAHLPLILGDDGQPLSKRHGAITVGEHREMGILPEALVNYLALLGWSPPAGQSELMDPATLTRHFSLARVSRSAARFDPDRLAWFNRRHLKRLPVERLLPEVTAELPGVERSMVERAVVAVKGEAGSLRAVVEQVTEVVREPNLPAAPASASGRAVLEALRQSIRGASLASEAEARAFIDHLERTLGMKKRMLMHAVRQALTGRPQGLPVATLLWVLGPEVVRRRAERALASVTA